VLQQTSSSLAAATRSLWANFGSDLTLCRDGNVVQWSYEGQMVIVAQQADGCATASFVDVPATDEVGGETISAIYRRTIERSYQMTPDSCSAMVSDRSRSSRSEREPFFLPSP